MYSNVYKRSDGKYASCYVDKCEERIAFRLEHDAHLFDSFKRGSNLLFFFLHATIIILVK